jgi:putative ABC transport system substrate-binding protein
LSFGKTSIFCLALLTAWTVLCERPSAEADGTVKIAVLLSTDQSPFDDVLGGFDEYIRQKDSGIVLDIHLIRDLPDPGRRSAEISEDEGVGLILALGSEALAVAAALDPDIPVVAGMILKKQDFDGLSNTTGVFLEYADTIQFEWLRRILPKARNVGVVYNRVENLGRIGAARKVAGEMGLQLVVQEVSSPLELPGALENLSNSVDVLWGVSDQVVLPPQTARHILLFSFRHRIPFIGLSTAWVKAGALYALDRDYKDLGRQCGELAWRVLRGEAADSIAPVAPRKVRYSLNIKTARRMKLEISQSLLREAEQIY